jgi:hypothetical protein
MHWSRNKRRSCIDIHWLLTESVLYRQGRSIKEGWRTLESCSYQNNIQSIQHHICLLPALHTPPKKEAIWQGLWLSELKVLYFLWESSGYRDTWTNPLICRISALRYCLICLGSCICSGSHGESKQVYPDHRDAGSRHRRRGLVTKMRASKGPRRLFIQTTWTTWCCPWIRFLNRRDMLTHCTPRAQPESDVNDRWVMDAIIMYT